MAKTIASSLHIVLIFFINRVENMIRHRVGIRTIVTSFEVKAIWKPISQQVIVRTESAGSLREFYFRIRNLGNAICFIPTMIYNVESFGKAFSGHYIIFVTDSIFRIGRLNTVARECMGHWSNEYYNSLLLNYVFRGTLPMLTPNLIERWRRTR
jgi:hypothetical protein